MRYSSSILFQLACGVTASTTMAKSQPSIPKLTLPVLSSRGLEDDECWAAIGTYPEDTNPIFDPALFPALTDNSDKYCTYDMTTQPMTMMCDAQSFFESTAETCDSLNGMMYGVTFYQKCDTFTMVVRGLLMCLPDTCDPEYFLSEMNLMQSVNNPCESGYVLDDDDKFDDDGGMDDEFDDDGGMDDFVDDGKMDDDDTPDCWDTIGTYPEGTNPILDPTLNIYEAVMTDPESYCTQSETMMCDVQSFFESTKENCDNVNGIIYGLKYVQMCDKSSDTRDMVAEGFLLCLPDSCDPEEVLSTMNEYNPVLEECTNYLQFDDDDDKFDDDGGMDDEFDDDGKMDDDDAPDCWDTIGAYPEGTNPILGPTILTTLVADTENYCTTDDSTQPVTNLCDGQSFFESTKENCDNVNGNIYGATYFQWCDKSSATMNMVVEGLLMCLPDVCNPEEVLSTMNEHQPEMKGCMNYLEFNDDDDNDFDDDGKMDDEIDDDDEMDDDDDDHLGEEFFQCFEDTFDINPFLSPELDPFTDFDCKTKNGESFCSLKNLTKKAKKKCKSTLYVMSGSTTTCGIHESTEFYADGYLCASKDCDIQTAGMSYLNVIRPPECADNGDVFNFKEVKDDDDVKSCVDSKQEKDDGMNCGSVFKKKKLCNKKDEEIGKKLKVICPVACKNKKKCNIPKCNKDWESAFGTCADIKKMNNKNKKMACAELGTDGKAFGYEACKQCGRCKN